MGQVQRPLLIGAILLASALGGWASAYWPDLIAILTGGLIGLMLLFLTRRHVLGWLHRVNAKVPAGTSYPNVNHRISALVLPRFLYYLGAASIALLTIRPTSALTISDWFFLASMLSTIGILLISGKLSFSGLPRGLVIGITLFAAAGFVSSLQSASVLASLAIVARFVYLTIAWFWLGTVVLQTPRHVRIAITCWTMSVALSGVASIIQLRLGDVIPSTSPIWGRMTGFAQHPNDLGASTAIALVPAIMLASVLTGRPAKIVGGLVLLTLVASGLLLSGSVGGLAAGSAGLVFWLAMRGLNTKVVVSGLVLAMTILLGFSLQGAGIQTPMARFQATTDVNSRHCSVCSRFDGYREAWDAIGDSPIVGAGMTGVTAAGNPVHNILLAAWFEAGLFGLVGIIIILGSVATTGMSAIRGARSPEEWAVCVALLGSFLSFLVIAMVQPVLFERYGWIGAGLLLVSWRQQVIQRAARETVPAMPQDPSKPVQERQNRWVPQPATFLGGPR